MNNLSVYSLWAVRCLPFWFYGLKCVDFVCVECEWMTWQVGFECLIGKTMTFERKLSSMFFKSRIRKSCPDNPNRVHWMSWMKETS